MNKEKIITILVAVILAGILIAIIFSMLGKRPAENYVQSPVPTIKPALPFSLSLEPVVLEATVGSQIKVDIIANAYGVNINGIDAVLLFDQKMIKVDKVEEAPEKRFLVPRKMISEEKVVITALRELEDTAPTGKEVIASVYFTALKKGKTEISFEFFPGKTVGSTIIKADGSENILKETKSAVITIL